MNKRKLLLFSSLLSIAVLASGCSSSQADLEYVIKQKLDKADIGIFQNYNGINKPVFGDFTFLSASLESDSSYNELNVYGISKLSTGKVAYTNLEFALPNNYHIDKLTYDSINQIVSTYALSAVKVHEVNNHLALNDTIDYLTKADKQNYYKESVMLYDISLPEIDELRGVAVFYTKSYVSTFKIPENITSDFVPSNENTIYDKYSVTNKIFVRLSPSEIQYLKQNPQLIYDRFTQAVEKHQDDLYSINNLEIERLDNEKYFHQKNINSEPELII